MAVDVEALYLRGKEAADGGNYRYAIEIFLDILKLQPEHVKTLRALRGCEMAMLQEAGPAGRIRGFFRGLRWLVEAFLPGMKPARVVSACERYLVHDPCNIIVLRRLGSAYEKLGYLEAAVDTLEFARQRQPSNAGVLRQLAEACYKKGDYERAVRCYQELLRYRPADRDAQLRSKNISAEWHLKRSHMEEAKSFREALRDEETAKRLAREESRVRTADIVAQRIAERQQAAEADPTNPMVWHALGNELMEAERFAEAEKAYAREFELSKKYEARERLGTARLRRLHQMERKAKEEADESGHAPELVARYNKARRDRLDFAIKEFEFRRQHQPTNLQIAWELGNYYFERGEPEDIQRAIREFQAAMQNPGLRLRARLNLARCFRRDRKTLDMARDTLVQALAEVESPTLEIAKEITYELGTVLEELGDKAEALKSYKKIYAVDAAYKDVAKKIQQLA